jgi:hypothetical protein
MFEKRSSPDIRKSSLFYFTLREDGIRYSEMFVFCFLIYAAVYSGRQSPTFRRFLECDASMFKVDVAVTIHWPMLREHEHAQKLLISSYENRNERMSYHFYGKVDVRKARPVLLMMRDMDDR